LIGILEMAGRLNVIIVAGRLTAAPCLPSGLSCFCGCPAGCALAIIWKGSNCDDESIGQELLY
jgi:hypothetical protein